VAQKIKIGYKATLQDVNVKPIVISSYTPAGTRKGTQARKSEKQASASLRGKAKGRKVATEKSVASKITSAIKKGIKTVERPFPAQVKGGRYTHRNP
jgi:hypothetical protein